MAYKTKKRRKRRKDKFDIWASSWYNLEKDASRNPFL
jgi:hypothetical protein